MSVHNDADALGDALTYLSRVLTRPRTWEEITKRAGVALDRPSVAILHALMQCSNEKVNCNLQDLAQHLGIEAPSVSRKVQELEQAGLVVRKQDPADRRIVVLHASAKGRKMLERIQKAKRDGMARLLSDWPVSDRKYFTKLLQRLATDINKEQSSN
jgi:DNA-binding MarR family transcriptional regulator